MSFVTKQQVNMILIVIDCLPSACKCVCVCVGCMPQRGRRITLIGQLLAPLFVRLFAPPTAASVCSVFQGFQSFSSFSFPSIRTFPSALSVLLIGFVRAPLTALNVPLIELINKGASSLTPARNPSGVTRNRLTTID